MFIKYSKTLEQFLETATTSDLLKFMRRFVNKTHPRMMKRITENPNSKKLVPFKRFLNKLKQSYGPIELGQRPPATWDYMRSRVLRDRFVASKAGTVPTIRQLRI